MRLVISAILTAASLALATSASAAEIVRKAPYYSYMPTTSWWDPARWDGLSVDVGMVRMWNSTILIDDGTQTKANMSGFHLAGTATYLIQVADHFVIGPRAQLGGGIIEAMPNGYIARTNATGCLGIEGGFAFNRFYTYGFGCVGTVWLSAERTGVGKVDNLASLLDIGAGVRVALKNGWYVKAEAFHRLIGDDQGAGAYYDRKASQGGLIGIGFQF